MGNSYTKYRQRISDLEKESLAKSDMIKARDIEIDGLMKALQARNEKYDTMTEELATAKEEVKHWRKYVKELEDQKGITIKEQIFNYLTGLFKKK